MGIRVTSGRGIDRRTVAQREPIAVVNAAAVKTFFGGQDPVGQRVRLGIQGAPPAAAAGGAPATGAPASAGAPARGGGPAAASGFAAAGGRAPAGGSGPAGATAFAGGPAPAPGPEWLTVVGVVVNTPTFGLAEPDPTPQLFMPLIAVRDPLAGTRADAMNYVVRTSSPEALLPLIRTAVNEVDANLAIAEVRTLQDILDRASSQMAFSMGLLVIAAVVALTLGVIGIYGVISYIVTQRTGEIGVRLLLGDSPSGITARIVRQGGLVALVGIGLGLAAALASSRWIESLLYGVSARDPWIFGGCALLLLLVALAACWVPARRAARLSPAQALRFE